MLRVADVMIVLGRVDDSGELTLDAHERIRFAAQMYREGRALAVVAPAKWSYKLKKAPAITEAAAIKGGLVAHGVPPEVVLLEEKSCDTLGGAYFLKVDFVLPNRWKRILVVTSEDHLERTKYVFHKVFGSGYEIQYVYGRRVLDDRAYAESLEREKRSLRLMDTTWIGPIVPGTHAMVKEVFKLHPGYNTHAKLSAEEIEARVQAQTV